MCTKMERKTEIEALASSNFIEYTNILERFVLTVSRRHLPKIFHSDFITRMCKGSELSIKPPD